MGRILAVDPGSKNLGIALSDPSGTIASPLMVIKHKSRSANACAIIELAQQHTARVVVVGQTFDQDGQPSYEGRRAARLAGEIRSKSDLEVVLWDESHSTAAARQAQITIGTPRSKRKGHLDDIAATIILQSYLDAMKINDEQTK
jgi:putative Holliday junction resolvase